MKTIIEITLHPVPYEHNVINLAGYLQTVVSEITNSKALVDINDYDFTDKMSIFRSMRKPSPTAHNATLSRTGITMGGSNSLAAGFQASSIRNVAVAQAHRGHGGPINTNSGFRTSSTSWQ